MKPDLQAEAKKSARSVSIDACSSASAYVREGDRRVRIIERWCVAPLHTHRVMTKNGLKSGGKWSISVLGIIAAACLGLENYYLNLLYRLVNYQEIPGSGSCFDGPLESGQFGIQGGCGKPGCLIQVVHDYVKPLLAQCM